MTICCDCGYPYDPEFEEEHGNDEGCPQCGCIDGKEWDEDYGKER